MSLNYIISIPNEKKKTIIRKMFILVGFYISSEVNF